MFRRGLITNTFQRPSLRPTNFKDYVRKLPDASIAGIDFEGHGDATFQGIDMFNNGYTRGGLRNENGKLIIEGRNHEYLGTLRDIVSDKLGSRAEITFYGCHCGLELAQKASEALILGREHTNGRENTVITIASTTDVYSLWWESPFKFQFLHAWNYVSGWTPVRFVNGTKK